MSFLHQPKPPTEEQTAVLASDARIRVVRACPGAGKTEVFVEAIRQRLIAWHHHGRGLAALSFTNIARETIDERIGGAVPAPHFVGTLDAFVFRFIVKPFGHLVGLPKGAVRLFPAPIADALDGPVISVGNENYQRASIFSVHFCGLSGSQPRISARLAKIGRFEVPADVVPNVLREKQRFWKSTGIVTHSDCQFLASCILHHREHGRRVREIIVGRFPELFIDELQDTGCFLARVFLKLFSDEHVSGLVVGDPNQAIYGFGGASPKVFDDFEKLPGANGLKLNLSQRCPKAVAEVVTALAPAGDLVDSLPNAPRGAASLVVHDLNVPTLAPRQANFLRGLLHGSSLAVIARRNSTVSGLTGTQVRNAFQGKSKSARRLSVAVQHLLTGEPREACRIVERELCRIVLGDEHASATTVREHGLSPWEWRAASFRVLATAAGHVLGESWNEWVGRVKQAVRLAAVSLRCSDCGAALRAYMICGKRGNALRSGLLAVTTAPIWNPADTITTIHRVKGAEFDTVVLFVPKTPSGECPSIQWWSDTDGGEERRIAFVAASRARKCFVLCLHTSSFNAMKRTRPEFIARFDPPINLPASS